MKLMMGRYFFSFGAAFSFGCVCFDAEKCL